MEIPACNKCGCPDINRLSKLEYETKFEKPLQGIDPLYNEPDTCAIIGELKGRKGAHDYCSDLVKSGYYDDKVAPDTSNARAFEERKRYYREPRRVHQRHLEMGRSNACGTSHFENPYERRHRRLKDGYYRDRNERYRTHGESDVPPVRHYRTSESHRMTHRDLENERMERLERSRLEHPRHHRERHRFLEAEYRLDPTLRQDRSRRPLVMKEHRHQPANDYYNYGHRKRIYHQYQASLSDSNTSNYTDSDCDMANSVCLDTPNSCPESPVSENSSPRASGLFSCVDHYPEECLETEDECLMEIKKHSMNLSNKTVQRPDKPCEPRYKKPKVKVVKRPSDAMVIDYEQQAINKEICELEKCIRQLHNQLCAPPECTTKTVRKKSNDK